jgi:hypothetical protein
VWADRRRRRQAVNLQYCTLAVTARSCGLNA